MKTRLAAKGLLVAVLFLSLGTAPAAAAGRVDPQQEDVIRDLAVFRWEDDGGRATYTVQSDGTGTRKLIDNAPYFASRFIETAISPDGTRVAFEAGGEFRSNIFVAALDGSGVVQLTHGRGFEHPSWSPDGSKIVADCGAQLCAMNGDGSGRPRDITHNDYSENSPQWAPNGRRIVFVTRAGLKTIRPDGTGLRTLTRRRDDSPVWSPNSRTIVFERRGRRYLHLWRVDADGSDPRRITSGAAYHDEPEWAPNGSRLVLIRTEDPVSEGEPECSYITTVASDGQDLEKLTDCLPSSYVNSYHPVWSPDGLRIAFCLRTAPAPGAAPHDDVWTMDADGGRWVNLTNETATHNNYFGLDW